MNFVLSMLIAQILYVSCTLQNENPDFIHSFSYEEVVNTTINNIIQNLTDPMESNFTTLDLGSNSTLISGQIDVKNLNIAGIKSLFAYDIKVDGLIPNGANLNISLPKLTVNTSYLADLKLLDGLPFFGHGGLNLSLGMSRIEIEAKWSIFHPDELIESLNIDYEIDELNLEVSGLYDSAELSQLVGTVVSSLKDVLNGMSTKIGSNLGEVVKDFINKQIANNGTKGFEELMEKYSYYEY